MKTNEDGFTLIETLLILMITSSLLLFSVLKINETIETVQIDLFFRELTSKITQLQTHALMTGESTEVKVVPGEELISFRIYEEGKENHILNEVWIIDSSYYEIGSYGARQFIFKGGSGNITGSDKIIFNTTKGRYELVYLMGSGRFDVRKR